MDETRWDRLETLLRRRGALSAAILATEIGVSQPTMSRLLAQSDGRVVRIGRARAARYALAHEVARMGSHWPLYRIRADTRAERMGELHALHGDEFFFAPDGDRSALMHGDFASGLYPGLPWFIDDQRPQGFLGRAFARRVAADIGASSDVLAWRGDDVVLALLRHGDDEPGDLVLGESSLQRALWAIHDPPEALSPRQRATRYPQFAVAALSGDAVGSSAAGEQPKFTAVLRGDEGSVAVIVKFSDRVHTPVGRRWADLLLAEHHAGVALRKGGLPAADGVIVEAGDRVFLQSTRFDRTPMRGRRGLVSLAALDAAYYGHGRSDWRTFAGELHRDGWLSADDAQRLRLTGWFGTLIANTDMHLGNASLRLVDRRPLPLAPAYDMLPMRFRPLASGEVVAQRYEITLPTPEQQGDWQKAAEMAREFWQRVNGDKRISATFRSIARESDAALARASAALAAT